MHLFTFYRKVNGDPSPYAGLLPARHGRGWPPADDRKRRKSIHINVEFLSLATTTLEEAILVLVVATFVFNLKVTRRLRNVQYFVERHIMKVEAEVRLTDNAREEPEVLSQVEWSHGYGNAWFWPQVSVEVQYVVNFQTVIVDTGMRSTEDWERGLSCWWSQECGNVCIWPYAWSQLAKDVTWRNNVVSNRTRAVTERY